MWRQVVSVLCLVSILLMLAEGQGDCVYEPGQFITIVDQEHGCVTLDCKSIVLNETSYTFDGWILSNVSYLNDSDGDKFTVDHGNWTLEIRNVSGPDTGYYHCVLLSETGRRYLVRIGLNARGPFFISGWQQYEMNTIVGLTSFASFVLLVVVGELLWKFRYKSDDDEADERGGGRPTSDPERAYTSLAFEFNKPQTPAIAAYVPCRDVVEPSTDKQSELRKRSPPTFDNKVDDRSNAVHQPATGVDNVAFVSDGIPHAEIPDGVATTSL